MANRFNEVADNLRQKLMDAMDAEGRGQSPYAALQYAQITAEALVCLLELEAMRQH